MTDRTFSDVSRRGTPTLIAVMLLIFVSSSGNAQDEASSILGRWRGSSLCTDREKVPGCKDEEVVYRVTRSAPDAPRSVHMDARKLVEGVEVPMGEMELIFDLESKQWVSEFRNARVHILWSFRAEGLDLTGTCTDLESRAVVRRVTARKQ